MKKILKAFPLVSMMLVSAVACQHANVSNSHEISNSEQKNDSSSSIDTREKFSVVFLTGIDLTIDAVEVYSGDKVKEPVFDPIDHYTLEGWYTDDAYTNRWNFDQDVVTATTILYANWNFEPYEMTVQLPTTHLLPDATDIHVVEGAPDLLILEAVLDSSHYFLSGSMSGYEYIKVFNNTNNEYNLKGHRVVLADPKSGQNGETEEAKKGNKPLVANYLFMGYIDDDYTIPALSTALLWLKPYYWTAGSGTNAANKLFSADLIHTYSAGQKGAFEQTIDDFREYWEINEATTVYEVTNMALAGKRDIAYSGTDDFYPIYSPGSGTPYTHLNSVLLRSLEIQKFNDHDGEVEINVLNKYSELSPEKQQNPDLIYGKKCFNVVEIKNKTTQEVIDAYHFENTYKYFEPIVRINFCGRIDTSTMTPGQEYVDFSTTSNPGIKYIETCVGLQFRPPLAGEKIMQWQLPVNELRKYEKYMNPSQLALLRLSPETVTDLRYQATTITVSVNPETTEVNLKVDEIKSKNRIQAAAPASIKAINLTYPTNS